jgi:hypothetical protein
MSNFAYLANGQIENFDTIIEGMGDKSSVDDYLNLVGNLKLAGTVYADNFVKDGKPLSEFEVTKLALPNNVYYVNKKMGINEEKPQADLDVKGKVRVQDETMLKKTYIDGLLKVGRDDSHPWNTGWGNGIHTGDLKVDATADINNLNTRSNVNIGGQVNAGGLVFDKNLPEHINKNSALYRHGGQVYLTVDDNLYVRNSSNTGQEDVVLTNFDTRNYRVNINSSDKNHIPLNVQSKHDSHIQLKTKDDEKKNIYLVNRDGHFRVHTHDMGDHFGVNKDGHSYFHSDHTHIPLKVSSKHDTHFQLTTKSDDNKNVYLVNRDGNFRLHQHGIGDMFGVNKDGHHYVRHTGDNVMHVEGDGNNPYISLGKTGKWGKNKWYLQNRNADKDDTSDFCIGRHDEGCKAVITKDGVLRVSAIELGNLTLSNTDNSLRIQNSNGFIDIGTKNNDWGHIYTDRPKFAFNKQITDVSNVPFVDYLRHNDNVTMKSNKGVGHRLQASDGNGSGWGIFANKNRSDWEQLSIEKCGAPGKDGINC